MASGENTPSHVGFFAQLWKTWVENGPLMTWKAPEIAYLLKEFDSVWCGKGLIVTCSE
jgi:hypothetical protein